MVESTFGQYKKEISPPGLYFTMFKTTFEISGRTISFDVNDIAPKTKNNVTIPDVDVTVYYKINTAKAVEIMLRYGGDYQYTKALDAYALAVNLITRETRESIYKGFAMYDATEIHMKREEISQYILKDLQTKLNAEMADAFHITNVIVRNIQTDPRLEEAIKAAAEVEFTVRKKNLELELAKSEAERLRIEAEGQAVANRIISNSLSPQLIELRRIESMTAFSKSGTHTVVIPSNTTPLITVK